MSRKYQFILVLAIASAIGAGLVGCGGGTPTTAIAGQVEIDHPIAFLHDYDAGMKLAREQRKPALVFFSIPDNVGSQRMLETTFRDEEIRRLAEWLVNIHVDGSQEAALCEQLGISSFPTIILYNANGVEVRRLVGSQNPEQLAVQIHTLLQVMALRPQANSGR